MAEENAELNRQWVELDQRWLLRVSKLKSGGIGIGFSCSLGYDELSKCEALLGYDGDLAGGVERYMRQKLNHEGWSFAAALNHLLEIAAVDDDDALHFRKQLEEFAQRLREEAMAKRAQRVAAAAKKDELKLRAPK